MNHIYLTLTTLHPSKIPLWLISSTFFYFDLFFVLINSSGIFKRTMFWMSDKYDSVNEYTEEVSESMKLLLLGVWEYAHLYIKIGRFVCPTGFVSECRTAGMPIMSQCQPYATMQHCGHAAYLGRRHLARSVFRPCPTACMRECLHRCVRWEDKEVAGRLQRAAMSYSLSKLRGGRRREGYMAMYAALSMLGGLRSQLRWHSETQTMETRLSPQPLRSCVLDRRFVLYCATW